MYPGESQHGHGVGLRAGGHHRDEGSRGLARRGQEPEAAGSGAEGRTIDGVALELLAAVEHQVGGGVAARRDHREPLAALPARCEHDRRPVRRPRGIVPVVVASEPERRCAALHARDLHPPGCDRERPRRLRRDVGDRAPVGRPRRGGGERVGRTDDVPVRPVQPAHDDRRAAHEIGSSAEVVGEALPVRRPCDRRRRDRVSLCHRRDVVAGRKHHEDVCRSRRVSDDDGEPCTLRRPGQVADGLVLGRPVDHGRCAVLGRRNLDERRCGGVRRHRDCDLAAPVAAVLPVPGRVPARLRVAAVVSDDEDDEARGRHGEDQPQRPPLERCADAGHSQKNRRGAPAWPVRPVAVISLWIG